MSKYTTLKFSVKLSEDGERIISKLDEAYLDAADEWYNSDETVLSAWASVSYVLNKGFEWARRKRSEFIPYGVVCRVFEPGWDEDKHFVKNSVWSVCCSLRNYDEDIEFFLNHILPQLISEPCTAEHWHEGDPYPTKVRVTPSLGVS